MIDKVKACKEVMKKFQLSSAQLDVLRTAARKYVDHYHYQHAGQHKLHNGEVPTYNVKSETLEILQQRGLIAKGHRVNDEKEREEMKHHAESLIVGAHRTFRLTANPFVDVETSDGPIVAWREVHSSLSMARGILNKLEETCHLITVSGRAIAAEWKIAVEAVEE